MISRNFILVALLVLVSMSCAQVSEGVKSVWGSSTRALENARVDGISQSFQCSFQDCYFAVLELARKKPLVVDYKNPPDSPKTPAEIAQEEIDNPGAFDVFLQDPYKGVIVVLGIRGNVDTTEVGIFFTNLSYTSTKIEVSSLSTSAKEKIAKAVFENLSKKFIVASKP